MNPSSFETTAGVYEQVRLRGGPLALVHSPRTNPSKVTGGTVHWIPRPHTNLTTWCPLSTVNICIGNSRMNSTFVISMKLLFRILSHAQLLCTVTKRETVFNSDTRKTENWNFHSWLMTSFSARNLSSFSCLCLWKSRSVLLMKSDLFFSFLFGSCKSLWLACFISMWFLPFYSYFSNFIPNF